MKKQYFFLALLLVFALSVFGAYAVKEKDPLPKAARVTLCARFCDNALVSALSEETAHGTLDGASCQILSHYAKPSTVYKEADGRTVSLSSRLYSDVFFVLLTEVSVRDGVPYANESFLSPGKRALLVSPLFYGECEIISVKVG